MKAPGKDEEKIQEATASQDAAKVISVDAAVIAVLSETDHVLTKKKNKHFIILPDGFGKRMGKHCSIRGSPQGDEARPNLDARGNRKLLLS